MRRFKLAVLFGILISALTLLGLPRIITAQPSIKEILAAPAPSRLPISQVILFKSGVGYFQREGEGNGNVQLNLAFLASDVNDLLKSLVLQDTSGGKVTSVTYDNQDPIERTLQS